MRRPQRAEEKPSRRSFKVPRAWDTAYYLDTCRRFDGDGMWVRIHTTKGRKGWKGRTPA